MQARYSFGVHADGTFAISKGMSKDVLSVNADGDVVARTKLLAAGALSADSGFVVDTVPQWSLWKSEDFAGAVEGWSMSDVTRCGGVTMLGGFEKTSKTTVSKTFKGLPAHSRVRIVANYHFIDLWQGEVGFMQTSSGAEGKMEYAWTDRYELPDAKGVVNVCGHDDYAEGHFSVPIDVTIVHTGDELTVSFGSTLTADPAQSSFGISGLNIYVRNT